MYMKEYNTWQDLIDLETQKPYFKTIKERLIADNLEGKNIFPSPKNFFRAFHLCNLESTRVVIIGQDPYHTFGAANGLAFSVSNEAKLQPSLKNIFKEIETDLGIKNIKGDLTNWARQGVLLLNTTLSVCEGMPGSHADIGWSVFTDKAIETIQNKKNIIFLLWGNHAKKKKPLISDSNYIFEAAHPSPLSAHNGFFGCQHFSKTNSKLVDLGLDPIDWKLD